jgi:ubiquinone/menaquinone biosynthesis C-methylase UbiE
MKSEAEVDLQLEAAVTSEREGKREHVRHVFENAPRYLKSRGVDIRCRIDTVHALASTLRHDRMLDIGCGDGSISLQLLDSESTLTLMDLSSSMLKIAKSNVPSGLAGRVEVRNEDFSTALFGTQRFDLIVAVGVMAHVDSPDAFLQKIKGLLAPGGTLIMEFTDAFHFVGRIGRFSGWLKELIAPAKYPTNKLSAARVAGIWKSHGFNLQSRFRYSRVPVAGFNRIVGHPFEHRIVKAVFGACTSNRNAWLGNEYICMLQPDRSPKAL